MSNQAEDLTGKRFGNWTVLKRAENRGQCLRWVCRCDCGTEREVYGENLRLGKSKSCGCIAHEMTGERSKTHGKRHTRLYAVWFHMKNRCYKETDPAYKNYGGRGITVCDEWLGSDGFQHFWDWAYENGYDENAERGECTLDRIDVNGNYCPENCRWAGKFLQANNKTNTIYVNLGCGISSLSDISREFNASKSLVYDRISRGWDLTDALFFPPKDVSGEKIEYRGEIHTQREWAQIFGISKSTFQYRLKSWGDFEEAAGIKEHKK